MRHPACLLGACRKALANALVLAWLLALSPFAFSQASIGDGGLRLDGSELCLGQDTSAWFATLGRPDRVFRGDSAERWHYVWDGLGLSAATGGMGDRGRMRRARLYFRTLMEASTSKSHICDWEINGFTGYMHRDSISALAKKYGLSQKDEEIIVKSSTPSLYAYPFQPIRQVRVAGQRITLKTSMTELNRRLGRRERPQFVHTSYGSIYVTEPHRKASKLVDEVGFFTYQGELECDGQGLKLRSFLSCERVLWFLSLEMEDTK